MYDHSEQPADETCETVVPIPRRPIPRLDGYVVAVVVVNVFELHSTDTADAHKDGAEEGDDEDADEVLPAVALNEPIFMFHCLVRFCLFQRGER